MRRRYQSLFKKFNQPCDGGDDYCCQEEMEGFFSNHNLRTVYVNGAIDETSAVSIHDSICQLLDENTILPIICHINCGGGEVEGGAFSIVDSLKMARECVPIYTYCHGIAYSSAALILATGDVGCRYISPLSRVMIHGIQAFIGFRDHYRDLPRDIKEIQVIAEAYTECLAKEILKKEGPQGGYIDPHERELTKTIDTIESYFKSGDFFLSANQARDFGIVDHVRTLIPHLVINSYIEKFEEGDDEEDGSPDN